MKGSHNPTKFTLETDPAKWNWTQQKPTESPSTVQPIPEPAQIEIPPQNGNMGTRYTDDDLMKELDNM